MKNEFKVKVIKFYIQYNIGNEDDDDDDDDSIVYLNKRNRVVCVCYLIFNKYK